MSKYSWKYNVPADANRVGNELEAIYEEHGKLTPPLIVTYLRSTLSTINVLNSLG